MVGDDDSNAEIEFDLGSMAGDNEDFLLGLQAFGMLLRSLLRFKSLVIFCYQFIHSSGTHFVGNDF
jgi:hypothetical protein